MSYETMPFIDELKENGIRLNELFSCLPGVIYRCKFDRNWTMEYLSPSCKKVTGYESEQLIGNKFIAYNEIIHPDYREVVWEKWQDIVKSKESFEFEYPIITSDGQVKWVWEQGHPVLTESGDILALEGYITDISDRKKVEEELLESKEMLRMVVDTIPIRVFWKDLNGKYLGCNIPFARDGGYDDPAELIGKDDYEAGWLEQADLYRKDDRQVMESGIPKLNYEEYQTTPDKGKRILKTSKVPLKKPNGEIFGVLGAYEDITESKKVQEERDLLQSRLLQSQKMEAIGRLAGGIAHDFNNMLMIIFGYTNLVIDNIEPNEKIMSYLNEIKKASEHSANLSRQLLTFARKQLISPKVINLNEAIKESLNMLEHLAGEKIRIVSNPNYNIPQIRIDTTQLQQLLINLILNSRDAITQNGIIIIKTDYILHQDKQNPELPEERNYVLLEVADNGCGMDEKTKDNIFEPFFTTKVFGKGTGLGLAAAYGIVKQNNGYIFVESEPGVGSSFKILLPPTEKKANAFNEEISLF